MKKTYNVTEKPRKPEAPTEPLCSYKCIGKAVLSQYETVKVPAGTTDIRLRSVDDYCGSSADIRFLKEVKLSESDKKSYQTALEKHKKYLIAYEKSLSEWEQQNAINIEILLERHYSEDESRKLIAALNQKSES